MLFRGLSAFPITPADADGRVDQGALRLLVRRLCTAEVGSIGVLGSTGAAVYLTREERRRAIEAAVTEAAGRTPVMVGIGALRTDVVLALARDAAECGADGLLLPPVSYTPLTEDEVARLFATVTDAVDLPICIYHNPMTTHFAFSPGLTARLAQLGRVVAVKNPAPDRDQAATIVALRSHLPQGFSVGVAMDARAPAAMLAGADAWYSVLAGVLPAPCVAIAAAAARGDAVTVAALTARLQPVWEIFQAETSFRTVYAMAELLGLSHARPPLPVLPLQDPARSRLAAVLKMESIAA